MSLKTVFFIVNECMDKGDNLYEMGVGGTASARGCGSSQYFSDHSLFKKEMLIWAHQQVIRLLKEHKTLISYAELHRRFEERYDLDSSCSDLRSAMIRMYNIKYVLLDYIKASYSVFNIMVGSRGDLDCIMTQVLVMMFRTVLILLFNLVLLRFTIDTFSYIYSFYIRGRDIILPSN